MHGEDFMPVKAEHDKLYREYKAIANDSEKIMDKHLAEGGMRALKDPAIRKKISEELGDIPARLEAKEKEIRAFEAKHNIQHGIRSPTAEAKLRKSDEEPPVSKPSVVPASIFQGTQTAAVASAKHAEIDNPHLKPHTSHHPKVLKPRKNK
jgi:uncharacterized protein involved in type VI secretion and phage assembly